MCGNTIEISKFASSLDSLHYQLYVANIKLTWVMLDDILLSTPLVAAKYDDKNKLIIKTFNFLLAFKKWKEGRSTINWPRHVGIGWVRVENSF